MNEIWVAMGGLLFSIAGGGFAVMKFFLPHESNTATKLMEKHPGWNRAYTLDRVHRWRWGLELIFVLLFIAAILTTIIGMSWFAIEE